MKISTHSGIPICPINVRIPILLGIMKYTPVDVNTPSPPTYYTHSRLFGVSGHTYLLPHQLKSRQCSWIHREHLHYKRTRCRSWATPTNSSDYLPQVTCVSGGRQGSDRTADSDKEVRPTVTSTSGLLGQCLVNGTVPGLNCCHLGSSRIYLGWHGQYLSSTVMKAHLGWHG